MAVTGSAVQSGLLFGVLEQQGSLSKRYEQKYIWPQLPLAAILQPWQEQQQIEADIIKRRTETESGL